MTQPKTHQSPFSLSFRLRLARFGILHHQTPRQQSRLRRLPSDVVCDTHEAAARTASGGHGVQCGTPYPSHSCPSPCNIRHDYRRLAARPQRTYLAVMIEEMATRCLMPARKLSPERSAVIIRSGLATSEDLPAATQTSPMGLSSTAETAHPASPVSRAANRLVKKLH